MVRQRSAKSLFPSSNLGAASNINTNALLAQLDRVSDYESLGRGFESLRARHMEFDFDILFVIIRDKRFI